SAAGTRRAAREAWVLRAGLGEGQGVRAPGRHDREEASARWHRASAERLRARRARSCDPRRRRVPRQGAERRIRAAHRQSRRRRSRAHRPDRGRGRRAPRERPAARTARARRARGLRGRALAPLRARVMRVIAGSAKGRTLVAPKGNATRPATDRIRESLFAILEPDLEGARVLDLFAGAGTLGIEALSRGAARVTFVERSAEALKALRKNLAATGFADRAQVSAANVVAFLDGVAGPFDLVF